MSDPLYACVRPLFFSLDAEAAHDLVLSGAELATHIPGGLAIARATYAPKPDSILKTSLGSLELDSPIGLAAGLDKNGVAIDFWGAIGFAFVEVGTVTPGEGQPGNPKPRLQRLVRDEALVNAMGFNNRGAEALATQLARRRSKVVVGANIGKAKITPLENAASDYVAALRAVWPNSDYVAINVSSPNTPGLRDLQSISVLRDLLQEIIKENELLSAESKGVPKPLFLKISPDLSDADLDEVADLAMGLNVAALIATNTTVRLDGLRDAPSIKGGLSGAPLGARALECTRRLYARVGDKLPIVGVGGIRTAEDAYARILAGASAIQVYTAFIYEGPGLIRALHDGLAQRLRSDGYSTIRDAIGKEPRGNASTLAKD